MSQWMGIVINKILRLAWNRKCSKSWNWWGLTMTSQEDSTPDLIWQHIVNRGSKHTVYIKLSLGYVLREYLKHKWILGLVLGSHLQEISLSICKYFKIHKKSDIWNTPGPSILGLGTLQLHRRHEDRKDGQSTCIPLAEGPGPRYSLCTQQWGSWVAVASSTGCGKLCSSMHWAWCPEEAPPCLSPEEKRSC